MLKKTLSVARKELWGYFASPTATIFLGSYLFVTLFTFFWVEKFFSRNIADLRPLFEWMPVLMIFLVSTLTMKMWSEERRMGTVEFLLTLPVKTAELVLGKFLACMGLVFLALVLTFGLALSVGMLGSVDWGPVFGAYLASLLLAAMYTAIGLYISSKTDSQIVSLILTCLACFVLFIIGSDSVVGFFGNKVGEVLTLVGSGSRFKAISRGILDLRDIYYYVSIACVFLAANVFSLERLKWSVGNKNPKHALATTFVTLILVNFLAANLWMNNVKSLRLDITSSKLYSISETSKNIISNLTEPLLIRGYFSARTHPLLAPLVPTIRDYLQEYQLASDGRVRTESIDPREDSEIEAEANRKYNIEPVPFQIADRHSASMVNSYFNIVVQYGDQFEVLNFNNLIEVKHDGMGNIEVELRNIEYDIDRAIIKVVKNFQNNDSLFANLKEQIKFVGYVSEATLPKQLAQLNEDIKKALDDYKKGAGDKLEVNFIDPSSDQEVAKDIAEKYGFSPQSMSLFSETTFYYYLTLQAGDKIYNLGVPENLNVAGFKTAMDATLRRLLPGFSKTVGLHMPPSAGSNPMMAQFGGGGGGKQFRAIEQKLGETYTTVAVDLENGRVPNEVDLLLVVAPKDLNEKQLFAVDQFLMKGGTVVLATSPIAVTKSQQGFSSEEYNSGLSEWLNHHGVGIPKELVLDEQNSGFPMVRKRVVQGITIREPYVAPYPFFIDIREKGLNLDNAITSGVGQLSMMWASPVVIDQEKQKERTVTTLVKSSPKSWKSTDISIEPNRDQYPDLGFPEGDKREAVVLAAMVEGSFESFFKGKDSPLIQKKTAETEEPKSEHEEKVKDESVVTSVINKSSKAARLVVFASNEFIADDTLQMSGMLNGSQYLNSLQLVENTVDWSTQDRSLLAIRGRGHFARTLVPLTDAQKRNWELINYAIAIFGLLLTYGGYKMRQRRYLQHFKELKIS